MLEEIAANDRGDDADRHLAGLLAQFNPEPPSGRFAWWPLEVLELEKCSEPGESEPGHLKRLLACVILLRNGAHLRSPYPHDLDDKYFLETLPTALGQLTASAMAAGQARLGLGFLLWLFETQTYTPLKPFVAFCALALATESGFGDALDEEIVEICSWVETEELTLRRSLGHRPRSDRWLTGLNLHERSSKRRAAWALLAKQVFEKPARGRSGIAADLLRSFSDRLAN